jgi:hypothetical protein
VGQRSAPRVLAVPKGASLILIHKADGEIKGLDEFPGAHLPPLPLFFGFRIMVGMGVPRLATHWAGWVLYRRAHWQPARLPRPLPRLLAGMTFSGWVATVAGWHMVGRLLPSPAQVTRRSLSMRAVFGVVGLLIVVAMVGLIARSQLQSRQAIAAAPAASSVREQSQQLQRQVADDVAKALSQGAARASEP